MLGSVEQGAQRRAWRGREKRVSVGFGKRFWQKGVFSEKSIDFLEILDNLEILENPQSVENKGESDHFLEILENLQILEIPPVRRPLS